jgi:phosphatidylinositol glycan class O
MPDDCVLFVMGDHGMTMSGDHGGDSHDEVSIFQIWWKQTFSAILLNLGGFYFEFQISAALFVYSKRLQFPSLLSNETITVNQVDLVPTFSLLMGIPIPFSNLGRVIQGLWGAKERAGGLLR